MNVTINGKEYYPDISSGISIELIPDEGEPILIEGGLLDLKEEAQYAYGVSLPDTFDPEDGTSLHYSNQDVDEYVDRNLHRFIYRKLEPDPQQEASDLFTTLSNAINPKR